MLASPEMLSSWSRSSASTRAISFGSPPVTGSRPGGTGAGGARDSSVSARRRLNGDAAASALAADQAPSVAGAGAIAGTGARGAAGSAARRAPGRRRRGAQAAAAAAASPARRCSALIFSMRVSAARSGSLSVSSATGGGAALGAAAAGVVRWRKRAALRPACPDARRSAGAR